MEWKKAVYIYHFIECFSPEFRSHLKRMTFKVWWTPNRSYFHSTRVRKDDIIEGRFALAFQGICIDDRSTRGNLEYARVYVIPEVQWIRVDTFCDKYIHGRSLLARIRFCGGSACFHRFASKSTRCAKRILGWWWLSGENGSRVPPRWCCEWVSSFGKREEKEKGRIPRDSEGHSVDPLVASFADLGRSSSSPDVTQVPIFNSDHLLTPLRKFCWQCKNNHEWGN